MDQVEKSHRNQMPDNRFVSAGVVREDSQEAGEGWVDGYSAVFVVRFSFPLL